MTESSGHTVRIAVERTDTFAGQSPADREQLAAMLSGNGNGHPLVDRLLVWLGSVAAIGRAHPADLTTMDGIDQATAGRIATPFQLARRAIAEQPLVPIAWESDIAATWQPLPWRQP
jgi:hypothetical protein